ncbi:MAG TPA: citryl-CoA lyase [Ktedonobacterales bacterium]|nr:citryl-CoA lyase [Ktedonobacterales bacterium]
MGSSGEQQPPAEYPTGIGTSTATSIQLLGHDLAGDLLGKVGFGELALWLATQRRPTPQQVRVFEAVLVALADHGFTPTAIAARLTLYSAPDALQGAIAAGLLGGGSRFLGVTEDTGRFLSGVLATVEGDLPATEEQWDALARRAVAAARSDGRYIPGLGHPVHKSGDPRTPVIIAIAEREGLRGPHLQLFEAIGRVHAEILGRTLPLNGAGVGGAALADLGLPPALLRGVALLARAAGLLGHLAEELRSPIAPDIYAAVDRHAVYRPRLDGGPSGAVDADTKQP